MPLTEPLSLLTATALLLLNELLKLAVAVLPLFAAAVPYPSALALPLLSRLSPVLLLFFWSELFELSLTCDAVEFSFAFGPAPVCVEVAVAVCVLSRTRRASDVFVGFAQTVPNASAMAVA